MNTLKRMTSLLTLGSFLVAQWPAVALADTSVRYLYNDARSTPVAAADEQGNLLWRKHYRPFGAEVELTGDETEAVADDRGFTGHTYDRESGLVYMGARYYNPRLGVFYGTDPAPVDPTAPMTFNRYIYANQNPHKYIDPDGRNPVWRLIVWVLKKVFRKGPRPGPPKPPAPPTPRQTPKPQNQRPPSPEPTARPGPGKVEPKRLRQAKNRRDDLPRLDSTGKLHGKLPNAKDLRRYSREELEEFRDDLRKSIKERIRKTVEKGRDRKHGQRQGGEQRLLKQVEQILDK